MTKHAEVHMEKTDRKTRISAITGILVKNPSKSFPLNTFCEMFDAAKSTISEDISMIRDTLGAYGLGDLEVAIGAAGGVKYIPAVTQDAKQDVLKEVAQKLSDPSRILPGGYIYTVDIFSDPKYVCAMAEILAGMYVRTNPDFIVTVETKGVALAFEVARALAKPLVIARSDSIITEGSAVTINYMTGISRRIRTMSISRRALRSGQKALLIDDFISGGGTLHALCGMMKELSITVVGCGVAIATRIPEKKRIDTYKALLLVEDVDQVAERITIRPV
jgi:purine operon repressor